MAKKVSNHTTNMSDINTIALDNKIAMAVKFLDNDEKENLLKYLENYLMGRK